MNRSTKIEKCSTPLNEYDIAVKIFRNDTQDLANLKILNILNDRNAAITVKSTDPPKNYESIISSMDNMTIKQSKILILSLKYSRSPNPINLITISAQKYIVNAKFAFSN